MEESRTRIQLQERATLAAKSYQNLARAFSSYVTEARGKKDEERKVFVLVTEKLCIGCPQYGQCWGEWQEECQDAFAYITEYTKRMGRLEYAVLPEYLQRVCPAAEELVEEWNRTQEAERLKRATFSQMMEGKEALVHQLQETANCFLRISDEAGMSGEEVPEEDKKELATLLKRYHIKVQRVMAAGKKGKGREWLLLVRNTSKRGVSVRLLEHLLSEKLGVPVREQNRWWRLFPGEAAELSFKEEPRYFALTGAAHSVKREQEISGDSFSFFYEDEGELTMILSDGMGSGEAASKESEELLSLLEQMLSAGFPEETAIRLINSVLALRVEQRSFATLDISRIHLHSGICEFIKIGGAVTYIKRGNWLERIETQTLPIGMVQRVEYDSLRKKLYDGDCIIMMSDGVLDAVPETERDAFLAGVIGADTQMDSQVMAGRILNASLLLQGFEPKDDMTVLVCSIYERKNGFQDRF